MKKQNRYVMVKRPGHPRARPSTGYVYEHILIMEEAIGRPLRPGETVHHINGKKDDNRLCNLMLFPSVSAHTKFHAAQWQVPEETKERNKKIKSLMSTHTVSQIAGELGLTRSQVDHAIRDYDLGTRISMYTKARALAGKLKALEGKYTQEQMAQMYDLTKARIYSLCCNYGIQYKKKEKKVKVQEKPRRAPRSCKGNKQWEWK